MQCGYEIASQFTLALQHSKTSAATAAAGSVYTAVPVDTGTPGEGAVVEDNPHDATKATEKCRVKSSTKSHTSLADDSHKTPSRSSQTTAAGSATT